MNGNIEIYHEMPMPMLVEDYEDKLHISGHYALVHLYENNREYFNYSVLRLRMGYTVILDNSIFELGKAFDMDRFVFWIKELVKYAGKANVNKHLVYIIPDVLDDADATINQCKEFVTRYPKLPGRRMAVAQGKTMAELRRCYKELNEITALDRTGVSFNCEAYKGDDPDQLVNWMRGRQAFVQQLVDLYNETSLPSPLHLLGCSLPQEFKAYTDSEAIISIDTSSPIVHGLKEIPFTSEGLKTKESVKLADLFLTVPTLRQLDVIRWNVSVFRWFVNGK